MGDEIISENHIYVLGGISYEKHTPHFDKNGRTKFTTPEFVPCLNMNDLQRLIEQFNERFGTEVFIHFVDPNLKIRYYYTPEGRAYFNILHDIRSNEDFKNVTFHDCQWYEMRDDIEINQDNDYHIVSFDDSFECSYDFLNFLELKVYNNVYIKYGIKSLMEIIDAKCPYNVFGAPDEFLTTMGEPAEQDHDALMWIIENGVRTVQAHIKAGFLAKERYVQVAVPCWTLNVESHFIKGIILEYEIFPPKKIMYSKRVCIGKTIQEKFTESAEYRYLITDTICRVLSQLGINYGKLSEVRYPHLVDFERLLA